MSVIQYLHVAGKIRQAVRDMHKTNYYSTLMLIEHHSSSTLRNLHRTNHAGRLEGGTPALDVLELGVQLAILHGTGGEGGGRLPLGGSARGGLLHHLVDLFEGKTLSLRNEEVGVHESACAEATPHEEDAGLEVALVGVDHVRGDDSDDTMRMLVFCIQCESSG
jgi:hypothetical protein